MTATPPGVPLSLQVTPDGSGNLVATWTAPEDPGSSAITRYVVTTQAETETKGTWHSTGSPTTTKLGTSATTTTLTGLSATGFYSVSVAAVSSAGKGTPATTDNPVTPTVQLASSTVVLTQTTMDSLASDDLSGTLTWDASAPAQVASLIVGDVLVAPASTAAPAGLLNTITAVTDTSGTYVITTTQANLSSAFTNLSFGYTGNPLAQPGSDFQARASGVRSLKRSSSANLTLSHDFAIPGGGIVSGDVNLAAALNFSAEVHTDFLIPDGLSLTSSATVTATASMDATLSGSYQWTLGQINLPDPITVFAGPVPIVIEPTIPVYLSVSGQISVGVEASVPGRGFDGVELPEPGFPPDFEPLSRTESGWEWPTARRVGHRLGFGLPPDPAPARDLRCRRSQPSGQRRSHGHGQLPRHALFHLGPEHRTRGRT